MLHFTMFFKTQNNVLTLLIAEPCIRLSKKGHKLTDEGWTDDQEQPYFHLLGNRSS